jgi:predicted RecB family nuclease
MKITDGHFESFLHCPFKSYLLINREVGIKTDFEILQTELQTKYENQILRILKNKYKEEEILEQSSITFSDLKKGKKIVIGKHIESHELICCINVLEKVNGKSTLGRFHYCPILLSHKEKLTKEDKILASFKGYVLNQLQSRQPEYARFIYGHKQKSIRIKISANNRQVKNYINEIKDFPDDLSAFFLNKNCQICEFQERCREKAIDEDHLSLLSHLGQKEIIKKKNKGIFTINQLAYTFRPRRNRKKANSYRRPHSIALRALAIREQKIHVYEMPILPEAKTEIYFDVEGLQDEKFNYLIGLIIVKDKEMQKYSFWANTPDEKLDIFYQFLNVMRDQNDFTLYHYGKYETNYLKRMKKSLSGEGALIEEIVKNSCNILSSFFTNIYLPTYTNGLKEVGKFLGFQWSDAKASGLQSLVWRKRWEMSGNNDYKEKLIRYNEEDCLALYQVKNLIESIIKKKLDDQSKVIHFNDFKKNSHLKFVFGEFAMPEIDHINKCAYFDYQRERVHVRTNPYLKKQYYKKQNKHRANYRPSKLINLATDAACPLCNKQKRKRVRALSKKVIDLKFTQSGVRRWVVEYHSSLYYCKKCKKNFIPQKYKDIKYKYGHNLMCWTIYQHIVHKQSFRQIEATLYELFGLRISKSNLHIFKSYINKYYRETFQNLNQKILDSNVIYADETPVNMKFETGYAWIFANMEEVVSFYKPTREGDFLKEYLSKYKGILVSDFYSAYDSLECQQQKCLIHLIRDFNDDLLKNPFNEEFKELAKQFTFLLQEIVKTIDRYGLKRRHLNKHNKGVNKFFKTVLYKDYSSDIAKQYQKRLARNQNKLFIFLNHDSVSWNNNTAEHAIKLLATHKNKNLNFFRESRMEEYLLLMSIYQTCHYKGISFLKFLLSKEKDIDSYCQQFLRKKRTD